MAWEKFKASTEVCVMGPMASENSQNAQKKWKNKSCNLSVQIAQDHFLAAQFTTIRNLMFISAPKEPATQMLWLHRVILRQDEMAK